MVIFHNPFLWYFCWAILPYLDWITWQSMCKLVWVCVRCAEWSYCNKTLFSYHIFGHLQRANTEEQILQSVLYTVMWHQGEKQWSEHWFRHPLHSSFQDLFLCSHFHFKLDSNCQAGVNKVSWQNVNRDRDATDHRGPSLEQHTWLHPH